MVSLNKLKKDLDIQYSRSKFKKDRIMMYEISTFVMLVRLGALLHRDYFAKFLALMSYYLGKAGNNEKDDKDPTPPIWSPDWDPGDDMFGFEEDSAGDRWTPGVGWDPLDLERRLREKGVPGNWIPGEDWDPLLLIPKSKKAWAAYNALPDNLKLGFGWDPLEVKKKAGKISSTVATDIPANLKPGKDWDPLKLKKGLKSLFARW